MTNQSETEKLAEAEKLAAQRKRFLCLAPPIQLGELAESLAFARSATELASAPKYIERALNSSLHQLDWMGSEGAAEICGELIDLRAQLMAWLPMVPTIFDDACQRQAIMKSLAEWSQKILDRSGLANQENWQVEFDYPPGIRAAAAVLA